MTDKEEIIRALSLWFKPGDVFEVRVLGATSSANRLEHTASGYFDCDHITDAAEAITKLFGYRGVYATANPVKRDLLARAVNRLRPIGRSEPTTSDADIERRRWLLIDCDADRPAGISSTDAEHEAALAKIRDIRDGLMSMGWPQPIMTDSGNGAQLMVAIDLPAQDGGLVQRCLAAIAVVSDDRVHVDVTVCNPARIWRVPGTMNCKGDHAEGFRPHRMAHLVEVPEKLVIVTEAQLKDLAGGSAAQTPAAGPSGQSSISELPDYRTESASFDLDEWIARYCPGIGEAKAYKDGRKWVFPVCPFNSDHSNRSAALFQNGEGAIGFRCLHNSCSGNDWRKLRVMLEPGCYDHREEHPGVDISGLLGVHTENSSVAASDVVTEAPQSILLDESAPEVSEEELRETLIETLPFPEHLYKIQGLVGEVMATTLDYSSTPNRPLALSGALALMSYLAARKVKTPTGLRSNIYLLALAGSGSGKERPRDINQIIIEEVGLSLGLLDGVASGAGLEDMLMVTPALLWQSDEFYSTLEEMLREGVTGTNTVMEKLLKMYTTSHKSYATRAKSGKQPVSIPNPNVTLYATTTPKAFFDHVNDRFLADGMYARLNLMVAEKPSGGHLPLEPKVSQDIIERCRQWALFKPEGSGNTNLKAMLAPYTADAAPMAAELFQKQQKRLVEMRGRDAPEWKCSIWNRYCETALRYALIYACSVASRPELTVLTPEALRWGGQFVEWEMENKFYMTDKNHFKTDFSKLQDIALTGIRKWHKEQGLGVPMPGWKFNRLLDGQPPNIVKAVTESLQDQERLFFMRSGRGFKYSLKRFQN